MRLAPATGTGLGGAARCRWLLPALLMPLVLLTACKQSLYTRLSEQEVNEMVAALAEGGISAEKAPDEERTWQIRVARDDFAQATRWLASRGLPRARFESMGRVFKKDSLVSSPNEERIRYIYALSQELSNTLSQIDGVILARVQPVLPANDPLSDKVALASAAVFIKHRADVDLKMLGPQIKELVMSSIEGLQYDRISLSFFPAEDAVRPRGEVRPLAAVNKAFELNAAPAPMSVQQRLQWGLGLLLAVAIVLAAGVAVWQRPALPEGWRRWTSMLQAGALQRLRPRR